VSSDSRLLSEQPPRWVAARFGRAFVREILSLPPGFYAGIAAVLAASGSLSLLPLWFDLLHMWATDPLRSIGFVFPLAAFAGVLAAWRRLGWTMNGTFWALPIIASSILLARIVSFSSFAIGTRHGMLHAVPVMFLYGVGAVLLFGGTHLLRASIAPLCLLLFVQPVPHAFNWLIDLPLQNLSASTARAFAHLLGLQPTGNQLRMMFSPDFGMMIVPGCNGVRGSITLGYLSLIFGYTRKLRPLILALTTLAALFLGYVLNLLRLCILVVYYRIGLSFHSLQKHGAGIDYAIGCSLFLLATLCIGLTIRSLERNPAASSHRVDDKNPVESRSHDNSSMPIGISTTVRSLCFLALTLAFIVPALRSTPPWSSLRPNEQEVLASFPAVVGPYRLTRKYSERDTNGMIVLALADYSGSPRDGVTDDKLTFGLWVGSGSHLVARSKFNQGFQAAWTGSFEADARPSLAVHFVTSFYEDALSRQYDAESICSDAWCSGHLASSRQGGFFFAAPPFSDLAFAPRDKRLPILIRREWTSDDQTQSARLRSQFESDARLFIGQINVLAFVHRFGSQP
jgi:exosortase J